MNNLKPCPFCGGSDTVLMVHQDFGSYYKSGVRCQSCRSMTLFDSETDDEREKTRQAVQKWNERVMP